MICSQLNRELGFFCRSLFGFIDRSFSTAMGCFIGCFRVRDDRAGRGRRSGPHLVVSDSSRPKLTDVVVSQNRLSSLFLSDDNSPFSDKSSSVYVGTPNTDKQLKNEAKFLKACGTLAETPIEIRKASSKLNGSPSPIRGGGSESSNYHSWLPSTSLKNFQLDKQIDQPSTPTKLREARAAVSGSVEQTPCSSMSNLQIAGSISVNSAEGSGGTGSICTPVVSTTKPEYKSKSVRFECDLDTPSSQGSSSEDYTQNLKKVDSSLGNQSMSRLSPYPTPLKLSDEMQTPGTVFPANLDNAPNGNTRIRSQYVHSVLNPIESVSQWNALKEEDPDSEQPLREQSELLDKPENETPKPKESVKEDSKVEASLSAWLKPVAHTQDGNFVGLPSRPRVPKTPMERPIIGMVAAHWNDDEPTRVSPKWWDGNGIPNSTNKYKEDQKVSWHATPFEERLEKALSEESIISQRKPICGTPIAFEESEESDSALSQLQSSSQPKSVISF